MHLTCAELLLAKPTKRSKILRLNKVKSLVFKSTKPATKSKLALSWGFEMDMSKHVS